MPQLGEFILRLEKLFNFYLKHFVSLEPVIRDPKNKCVITFFKFTSCGVLLHHYKKSCVWQMLEDLCFRFFIDFLLLEPQKPTCFLTLSTNISMRELRRLLF